jgi:hypothetical protein
MTASKEGSVGSGGLADGVPGLTSTGICNGFSAILY